MDLFRSAASGLMIFFSSSQTPAGSPALCGSPTSFPQFAKLPAELRLRIWRFAIEPRVLRVHLRTYQPAWLDAEERWEGYALDDPEHSGLSEPFDEPNFLPETEEAGGSIYGDGSRPCHMAITPCIDSHHCKCENYPPKSRHALPLPNVLFACHESRDAGIATYSRCLDDEYDTRGLPVVSPTSHLVKSPISTPPETGLMINPSIDSILVPVNVASRADVKELHHFAAIIAWQVPDVRKVIVCLRIAMAPYKFWSSARFQYWRNWGEDGWWVPVRFLVQMRGLEEVVFLRHRKEKMLPAEWRNRTEAQWAEEFLKMEERWPVEWEGRMPSLRFAQEVAEA